MIRILFRSGLVLVALAALAAGCLSLLGQMDPRADLFAHFVMVWGPAGLMATGLLVLGDRPNRRALSLALLVANLTVVGFLVGPEFVRSSGPRVDSAYTDRIRVVSFNVWGENKDPEGTLEWILSQTPDIIVLAEVSVNSRVIARSLRDTYPYRVTCTPPHFCSTMIYSRWPLDQAEGLGNPGPGRQSVSAVRARVRAPGGNFAVVAVHTVRPTSPEVLNSQIQEIAEVLRPQDRRSGIMAGDFNATPWSAVLQRMDRLSGLVRRSRGEPTWPAYWKGKHWPLPVLAIDQFYAGSDWATVSRRVSPGLGSDHRGLVTDLARMPTD